MGAPRSPFDQALTWNTGEQFPNIVANVIRDRRDPTEIDRAWPVGQLWVNVVGRRAYALTLVEGGVAHWNLVAAFGTDLETLTGNSGGTVGPDAEFNIQLEGDVDTVLVEADPEAHSLTIRGLFPVIAGETTTVGPETQRLLTLPITLGHSLTALVNFTGTSSEGTAGGTLIATAKNKLGTSLLCGPDSIYYAVEAPINGATVEAWATGGDLLVDAIGTGAGLGNIEIRWKGVARFVETGADQDPFWIVVEEGQAMEQNQGYILDSDSPASFSLPSAASVGSLSGAAAGSSGMWSLTQGAGQSIIVGDQQTTVGPTGSLSSIEPGDAVLLLCVEENTTWMAIAVQGSLLGV